MHRFTDHRVMVTGAGSGIGAAIARRLAEEGARVLVTDIDGTRAERTAREITTAGGQGEPLACDVGDQAAVDAAVAHAAESWGGLEVLVNNAFAAYQPDAPHIEETTDAAWFPGFDITLHGAYRVCRAAMPHLAAAGGRGSIVNIGSVNGEQAFGGHAYSAAKAGLSSLTRTLAVQNASRGVRVNLVAPGTVDTPSWDDRREQLARYATHYPLGRVGRPEDIAAAVAFLASSDASWITGLTLPVDGGIMISNLGMDTYLDTTKPHGG